jgi:type II secretory pathway pseudopilin PulG
MAGRTITSSNAGAGAIVRRFASESGLGLLELVFAMTILAIAMTALLSALVGGEVSLRRADEKGTALTLAEKQLETYRVVSYANIRLDQATINAIASTDPYMTAHSSDATIPSGASSGQAVGGANGNNTCPTPLPVQCQPDQTVTGPDHRNYRIDTYITYVTPTGGQQLKQVLVVVRDATQTSLPILARLGSTFSQEGNASG